MRTKFGLCNLCDASLCTSISEGWPLPGSTLSGRRILRSRGTFFASCIVTYRVPCIQIAITLTLTTSYRVQTAIQHSEELGVVSVRCDYTWSADAAHIQAQSSTAKQAIGVAHFSHLFSSCIASLIENVQLPTVLF